MQAWGTAAASPPAFAAEGRRAKRSLAQAGSLNLPNAGGLAAAAPQAFWERETYKEARRGHILVMIINVVRDVIKSGQEKEGAAKKEMRTRYVCAGSAA